MADRRGGTIVVRGIHLEKTRADGLPQIGHGTHGIRVGIFRRRDNAKCALIQIGAGGTQAGLLRSTHRMAAHKVPVRCENFFQRRDHRLLHTPHIGHPGRRRNSFLDRLGRVIQTVHRKAENHHAAGGGNLGGVGAAEIDQLLRLQFRDHLRTPCPSTEFRLRRALAQRHKQ